MNRRYLAVCLLGALSLALTSCGDKSTPAPKGAYAPAGDGTYSLLDTFYDDVNLGVAKDKAAAALVQLQNEPNACLVGLWAYNPPAILSAVQDAQKVGKVHIVGFDEMEDTLRGVKDGSVYGTVVQQPFEFGYQSVKLLAALAHGDRSGLPANGILHVPHLILKKDNVEAFHTQLKERLSKKPAPGKASGDIKVAFVSNNAEEFWTIAEAGTRKAEAEFGVQVIFRRPGTGTAEEQKEIIEDLLTQGVKGIAISVNDPKNQIDLLNQVASRMPLITQDNDAPDSKRLCYIGTDNYAAGKAAGKLVKETMPTGGKVAIFVGKPDPLNARERRQGVLDELGIK